MQRGIVAHRTPRPVSVGIRQPAPRRRRAAVSLPCTGRHTAACQTAYTGINQGECSMKRWTHLFVALALAVTLFAAVPTGAQTVPYVSPRGMLQTYYGYINT